MGCVPTLRIGPIEVKWHIFRVTIVIWAVLVASLTAEVYLDKGSLSPALVLASLSQFVYIVDLFLFEVCFFSYNDQNRFQTTKINHHTEIYDKVQVIKKILGYSDLHSLD